LRWCTKPFMTKSSYFLEKDITLYQELIVFELSYASWVNNIYWPRTLYPKAKLTLTSISWLAVQYKMGILRLVFIFCCIHSWMALHVRIKTYFLPVFYSITPVNYHLRLQCLYNCQETQLNSRFHGFPWLLSELPRC
jgi:hypothetical protein